MIKRFRVLRMIPQLKLDLYVVFTDKRSFYVAVPDDVQLTDENVNEYKVSNTLYEHLLFVDFE